MTSTKGTTVPTFIEACDAAALDVEALRMLSHSAATPAEADYVTGLIMRADSLATERGVEARVSRYAAIGDALSHYVRQVINTGGAKDTKGNVRTPLASDQAVSFADVRDALSLRESADRWTPNVTGTKPVGKTECQRYWEAAQVSADHVRSAIVKLTKDDGTLPDNAKTIVETAAVIRRDASLTPAELAKREAKRNERETAKSAKDDAAKRRDERESAACKLAVDATPLIDEAACESADIGAVFATWLMLAERIEAWHVASESEYVESHKADEALAAIAAARGVSIDEMRELIDSLTAAKMADREAV